MRHKGLEDLVAGYVLSALDREEQRRFEAHLATCSRCGRRVAEFQALAHALPLTAEEIEPPLELKERLLAAVRAERLPVAVPQVVPPVRPQPVLRPRGRWFAYPAVAATTMAAVVVLAVAVASLALWTNRLQDRVAIGQSRLDTTYRAIDIMGRAEHRWAFKGTEAAPNASGALTHSTLDSAFCLLVWDMPPANGQSYQAWTIKDGVTTRAGALRPTVSGLWAIIPGEMEGVDAVQVTRERERGLAQPQGPVLMSVSLRSS
ncbi:MAG: anti-sigma factor [Chloroflexi bacterium]|nr:anti-sigma factor [Chloroflexota bacterium]